MVDTGGPVHAAVDVETRRYSPASERTGEGRGSWFPRLVYAAVPKAPSSTPPQACGRRRTVRSTTDGAAPPRTHALALAHAHAHTHAHTHARTCSHSSSSCSVWAAHTQCRDDRTTQSPQPRAKPRWLHGCARRYWWHMETRDTKWTNPNKAAAKSLAELAAEADAGEVTSDDEEEEEEEEGEEGVAEEEEQEQEEAMEPQDAQEVQEHEEVAEAAAAAVVQGDATEGDNADGVEEGEAQEQGTDEQEQEVGEESTSFSSAQDLNPRGGTWRQAIESEAAARSGDGGGTRDQSQEQHVAGEEKQHAQPEQQAGAPREPTGAASAATAAAAAAPGEGTAAVGAEAAAAGGRLTPATLPPAATQEEPATLLSATATPDEQAALAKLAQWEAAQQ